MNQLSLPPRWNRVLRHAGRALLPLRCVVCGGAGEDLDLCAACRTALPWNERACRRCGLAVAGDAEDCGACRLRPPPFTRVQCPLRYAFPVDRLVPRFKFHGDLAAGEVLATLVHWGLDPADRPQALVPVPLHRARLRERGYDQALELARALARLGGPPVQGGALRRLRATAAQSRLGAGARRGNLRGAFGLRPGYELPAHVALVDDVMTTGATLAECAAVLLDAGVQRVDAWCIARA
jgi:ComF family protein